MFPFIHRMCPWALKSPPIMTIKAGRVTSPWLKFFSIPRAYSTKDGVAIIHFSCNLDTLNHLDWVLQQNSIRDQTRAACESKRALYPFVPSGMTIEVCLIELIDRNLALWSTTCNKISCPIVCSPSFATPTGPRGPRGVRTGCLRWTGSCWSGSGARTPSDRLVRILSPWLWGHISKEKQLAFWVELGKGE